MEAFKISRRNVLRGVVGGAAVSVGLPPLEAMFNANGTAHADGTALPRRLGIFFWGNGIKKDRWNPTTTGANWAISPELEPLMPVKDYITVVSGMKVMIPPSQGHHTGAVGILSGNPLTKQAASGAPFRSTFSTPSVDQVAAAVIGKTTKFKSLEVGLSTKVNTREGTSLQYLSHNGPDNPNPSEYQPAKLFERVFGAGFTPPAGNGMPIVDVTKALRRSILDAVLVDINAVKGRAGTRDKMRLDQHLENIRGIEKRLENDTTLPAACKAPAMPNASYPEMGGREPLEERTKAFSDLMAVALACDQTRVFSMLFSPGTGFTVFPQVMVNAGHHGLTHDEGGAQPGVHAVTTFIMKTFSILVQTLKGIPEGAGNILDNCFIYGSSDVADGRAHDLSDYPLVIAGKAGGFLKYPGVHYRSTTNENTNLVLLSALRSVGLPLTEFGSGQSLVKDSCTAIEA
jgi:hypothetical protein